MLTWIINLAHVPARSTGVHAAAPNGTPAPLPPPGTTNPGQRAALQGKQMVEVLNACGVQAACVGNHDFDFSVEVAQQRFAECSFPWCACVGLQGAATGWGCRRRRRAAAGTCARGDSCSALLQRTQPASRAPLPR